MTAIRLSDLKEGDEGYILSISGTSIERFLKMGFLEGAHLKVMHEAPFGADPIAVKVRDTLIAIRRDDARQIQVERIKK